MTTPLEKAERDLNNLEEQREALFSRAKLLSKQRDQIAFAALTAGDKKAKEKLSEINAEDTGLAANIASVEAALTVARSNVANAKQAEAVLADRAKAEQIRALKVAFVENGINAGDALSDFVGSLLEMMQQRDQMQALGLTAPTSRQFHVSALIAIKTVLQTLPQPMVNELQEWSLLLHPARRSFGDITASWDAMITRQIAERLGDDNERAA
jgi:chromosome segregation ATPase